MKLNDNVRESIRRSVLCWLATVDADGAPSVSPKEIFCSYGESRLLIANIASPQSVKNICGDSRVCVSFVDIFEQKGYKIKGLADVIEVGSDTFDKVGEEILAMAGDFPVKSIISVSITKIEKIIAPSYVLFPERAKEERVASAYQTYGVAPVQAQDRYYS